MPLANYATAPASAGSDPVLLGDQGVEGSVDYNQAGLAEAFPFTTNVAGAGQSVSVYLDQHNRAKTLVVALYSNEAGHPGSRVSTGSLVSPRAGAWNTVKVSSVSLNPNTTYWLAVLGEGGALYFRDRLVGACSSENSSQTKLTTLPSGWSPGATWGTCPISAYVSGTTATSSLSVPADPPTVALSPPTNTNPPVVSGSAVLGQTLTTTDGSWTGSPAGFTYQWEDCDVSGANCTPILTALSNSYTLAAGDVGHTIRAVVTAVNLGGATGASSAQTAVVQSSVPAAPTSTAAPVVSGTATQGQTLTSSNGSWTNSPSAFAYKWEDCDSSGAGCSSISGATSSSYTLAAGDVGHTIRSVVTASNAGGSNSSSSAQTAVVQSSVPAAPTSTAAPVVSGTATQGQTLTSSNGSWTNSPSAFAYKWEDCDSSGAGCSSISGATSSSYTLAAGDVGHTIRSVVTASNAGGSNSSSSAQTAVVQSSVPAAPTSTAAPVVSGTATQGQTLTSSNGSWTNSPSAFAYKWEDCDSSGAGCSSISGATSSSYTLAAGDVGHTIRSVVTASNAGGSNSSSSAQTPLAQSSGGTPSCTTTVSSVSAAQTAVSSAADGSTVCFAAGTYGTLNLSRSGAHNAAVTLEPIPSADPNGAGKVTLGAVNLNGSYITVSNFYISGGVSLGAGGASHLTIDHNEITGGGEGISGGGVDCQAPHAPGYSGCTTAKPISSITISGNRIHGYGQGGTEDAIHLNNWQNVQVTGNDIYNLIETGNHTDVLQSVFGGSGLTFDHNYVHDNQAEGPLLKDGDVINATETDNLFVRGNISGDGESYPQVFDTHNFVFENNTIWSDGGLVRTGGDSAPSSCSGDPYCSTSPYSATIDHNVVGGFNNGTGSDPYPVFTESHNLFGSSPFTFKASSTDVVNAHPAFACGSSCGNGTPAGDDYELASNPNGEGIDWSPANQVYGPVSS